jgi:hypothetical protein
MKDEDKTVDGQSFYAEHLTGSGTILPDGTYGPPQPDPTVLRGGPKGERTSPGGVKRPAPAELTPPAQRAELESGESGTTSRTAKRANQK